MGDNEGKKGEGQQRNMNKDSWTQTMQEDLLWEWEWKGRGE